MATQYPKTERIVDFRARNVLRKPIKLLKR